MQWLIVALIILFLYTMKASAKAPTATAEFINNSYGDAVVSECRVWNINPIRVFAMIYQESAGKPDALGSIGERGLMQLTQGALLDVNRFMGWHYSFDELFNPTVNVKVGVAYLGIQRRRFNGDIDRATQAYNAGAGAVSNDATAGLQYLVSVKQKEQYFII